MITLFVKFGDYKMNRSTEKILIICEKCGKHMEYNPNDSYKIIKLAKQKGKILCPICKMKRAFKRKEK